MTNFAAIERRAVVTALRDAGPNAPTLCAGWTAADLAAHLVARERRPDSLPGIRLTVANRWTERVRRTMLAKPYHELLTLIETGPGRRSPFALPGADQLVNFAEYFIHTEDVRRASAGWDAAAAGALRDLAPGEQDELWRRLKVMGRIVLGSRAGAVRLVRPDGREIALGPTGTAVRIIGEPAEIVLWLAGRADYAQVTMEGAPADLDRVNVQRSL